MDCILGGSDPCPEDTDTGGVASAGLESVLGAFSRGRRARGRHSGWMQGEVSGWWSPGSPFPRV